MISYTVSTITSFIDSCACRSCFPRNADFRFCLQQNHSSNEDRPATARPLITPPASAPLVVVNVEELVMLPPGMLEIAEETLVVKVDMMLDPDVVLGEDCNCVLSLDANVEGMAKSWLAKLIEVAELKSIEGPSVSV